MDKKITTLFYIILPLLTIGINFGYTIFSICILALLCRLLFSNKDTAGFYLLMFGGPLAGIIRMSYPSIPIYGLVLNFVGVLLMRNYFSSFLKERKASMRSMFLVILVFFMSYLFAEHTPYANDKMFQIFFHGSLMLWGYYVYAKSNKISFEHLCQLLLVTSIAFISFPIREYGLSVGSIIDYNWLRSQLETYMYVNDEPTLISYQNIGMLSLFGYSLYLSKTHLDKKKIVYYTFIAFQIILMSGARQAILGFLVIAFLRFAFFNNKKSISKVMYIVMGAMMTVLLVLMIVRSGSEAIDAALESGGSGRDLIYVDALRIISQNLMFGVGLGGFPLHSVMATWPHNFFLELLCEIGLVGTLALFFIVLIYMINNRVSLRICTRSNNYYFLVVLALFIRVMISGDLTESIEIFSAILAVSSIYKLRNV